MYSDDSEDDDIYSYSRASLVPHPSEQINLRLYHNDELESRRLGPQLYLKYRVFRFFKALKGYHLVSPSTGCSSPTNAPHFKGNLDLSGRHAEVCSHYSYTPSVILIYQILIALQIFAETIE